MKLRVLSENEASQLLISILATAQRAMTTREIEHETRRRMVQCPDKTPILLNRLRLKGVIRGELSTGRRAWIWWVESKAKRS